MRRAAASGVARAIASGSSDLDPGRSQLVHDKIQDELTTAFTRLRGAAATQNASTESGPGIADATCVYVRDEGNVSNQDSSHALTAGFRMTW
jgi:hypothetical protein